MVVPQLPSELWREVVKWLKVHDKENYELEWIVEFRLLCRGFARATKEHVAAFDLNTGRFFDQLQLGEVYRMRRTPRGRQLYCSAMCMLYRRFHSTKWLDYHQKKQNVTVKKSDRMAAGERRRRLLSEYFDKLFHFLKCPDFDNNIDVFVANLHDRYWVLRQRLDNSTNLNMKEALYRRRSAGL